MKAPSGDRWREMFDSLSSVPRKNVRLPKTLTAAQKKAAHRANLSRAQLIRREMEKAAGLMFGRNRWATRRD